MQKQKKVKKNKFLQDDTKSNQKEKTKREKVRKTRQKMKKLNRHDWLVMKNYT